MSESSSPPPLTRTPSTSGPWAAFRNGRKRIFGLISFIPLAIYLFIGLSLLPQTRWLFGHPYPHHVFPYTSIEPIQISLISGCAFNLFHHAAVNGLRYAVCWAFLFMLVGGIMESIGVTTGFIFGRYSFANPSCFGPYIGVLPVGIPAAWYCLAYPSWVIAANVCGRRSCSVDEVFRSRPWTMSICAALALTATDIIGDPLFSYNGGHLRYLYDNIDSLPWAIQRQRDWKWIGYPSASSTTVSWTIFFGVPIHNFLGWFVTSLVGYQLCRLIPSRLSPPPIARRPGQPFQWWYSPQFAGLLPIVPFLSTGLYYAIHSAVPFTLRLLAIPLMIFPASVAAGLLISGDAPPLSRSSSSSTSTSSPSTSASSGRSTKPLPALDGATLKRTPSQLSAINEEKSNNPKSNSSLLSSIFSSAKSRPSTNTTHGSITANSNIAMSEEDHHALIHQNSHLLYKRKNPPPSSSLTRTNNNSTANANKK